MLKSRDPHLAGGKKDHLLYKKTDAQKAEEHTNALIVGKSVEWGQAKSKPERKEYMEFGDNLGRSTGVAQPTIVEGLAGGYDDFTL